MASKDKIYLYPCIKIVRGAKKSALYDLQRCKIYSIPNSFLNILSNGCLDRDEAVKNYPNYVHIVNQYFDFLMDNELAIGADVVKGCELEDIDETYYSSSIITHAILDYDKTMSYPLKLAINELSSLHCEGVKIRFFDIMPMAFIIDTFELFRNTTIRGVEYIIQFNENSHDYCKLSNAVELYPRIQSIVISNSKSEDKCIETPLSKKIRFSNVQIKTSDNCGNFHSSFLRPIQEFYFLSKNYNNCLHGLVSIDRNGNICNCPSLTLRFGKFPEVSIMEAMTYDKFYELWNIKKDQIDSCKDCALRYACQDCRAYIDLTKNKYAKPSKCNFNPYD